MIVHQKPTIVLVIQDDPILLMTMVDYVEEAGCEAVETGNVVEAIRILESRTDIHTVFTDLDMRGSMAGMKLAISIRDRWPPIELILASSAPWALGPLPARGIVVDKPFRKGTVVSAIRSFTA